MTSAPGPVSAEGDTNNGKVKGPVRNIYWAPSAGSEIENKYGCPAQSPTVITAVFSFTNKKHLHEEQLHSCRTIPATTSWLFAAYHLTIRCQQRTLNPTTHWLVYLQSSAEQKGGLPGVSLSLLDTGRQSAGAKHQDQC